MSVRMKYYNNNFSLQYQSVSYKSTRYRYEDKNMFVNSHKGTVPYGNLRNVCHSQMVYSLH